MKKMVLLSAMFLALPLSMMAQDDDLYFVPKKQVKVKNVPTYYAGSSRDVDEYNRRGQFKSTVSELGDDVIDFDGMAGVYPDSISVDSLMALSARRNGLSDYNGSYSDYDDNDDYRYSRQLDRWYGVYDPWFYGPGYYGFHSPFWRSHYYGWYDPWYDPWYYGYGPWGYYGSWYGGWYDPWYWGGHWGWYHDPWYWGGGYYPGHIPGGGHHVSPNGIAGTSNHGPVTRPGQIGTGAGTRTKGSFGGARNHSGATTVQRNGSINRMGASAANVRRSAASTTNRNTEASRSTQSYSSSHSYRPTSSSGASSFGGSSSGGFSGGGSRSSGGGGGHSGGSFGGGRR